MFQDIKSYFAMKSLISEDMFGALSLNGSGYPFEEEFKTVESFQRFGLEGVADEGYRGILEE